MLAHWEFFAKRNPFFYSATNIKTKQGDTARFWKSGEMNYRSFILPILHRYKIKNDLAVDFGCGPGRYLFPLAGYFKHVAGVDISATMLKIAEQERIRRNISNVELIDSATFFEQYINENKINFIYSTNVFQHLESWEAIERIIQFFSQIVNGYAYLQFDTREEDMMYRLKLKLPDILLPKTHRKGIRRIRRSSEVLKKLFTAVDFKIAEEFQPNSEFHYFLLKI